MQCNFAVGPEHSNEHRSSYALSASTGTSGQEAQAALDFASDLLQLTNEIDALAASPLPGQRRLAQQLAVALKPPLSMTDTLVRGLLEVIRTRMCLPSLSLTPKVMTHMRYV